MFIAFSEERQERSSFGGGNKGGFGGRKSFNDDPGTPGPKLMIRGLSYDTTQDTLESMFTEAERVHIAMDKSTGESRG